MRKIMVRQGPLNLRRKMVNAGGRGALGMEHDRLGGRYLELTLSFSIQRFA
jgi:hypothetical protein